MAKDENDWTPYGLEAIRQAHLKRRRLLGALAALGILLLGGLMIETTTTSRLSLSANGNELTDSVSIPEPDKPEEKDKHVTVALSPGRVTRAESGNAAQDPQLEPSSLAPSVRGTPYPWRLWALQAAPFALAGLVAYLLAKRRGRHDEVNYGVFKGAMPLELLTAAHQDVVFTKRHAKAGVFGKRRADHLPPHMAEANEEA